MCVCVCVSVNHSGRRYNSSCVTSICLGAMEAGIFEITNLNTCSSLLLDAVGLGTEMLELDVHITKDEQARITPVGDGEPL